MNVAKIVVAILFLYIISFAIVYLIKHRWIFFPFFGILITSLILFSILFTIFIVFLAIYYAITKKPEIQEGSFSIDKIKGKEEF